MQWHIARRRFGLLAERADARIGHPRVELLPDDLRLAGVDRIDDAVADFFRQVGARVERPGAVVDARVVGVEAAVDAFRHHHAPPAELPEAPENFRLERERPIAGGERVLEPQRKAFVEDRIDAPFGDGFQPPCIARTAVELEAPAPALELGDGKAVQRERLVDEAARRMRRILAGGKAQRDALRAYLGERLDAKPRMHGEHETVPRWLVRDDAERQWFLEQPAA